MNDGGRETFKSILSLITVIMMVTGCSQYSAPTETNIKVSSISYSELMANPNHIIIGGIKEVSDTDEDNGHWVDTIDPNTMTFKKNLNQGNWLFFGRMFLGKEEYCTVEKANLNQESQDIELNFSRSKCSEAPLSSLGIKTANLYFCEDIYSEKDDCLSNAGNTKSLQFDFYKTIDENDGPYFTSDCYQVNDGFVSLTAPFFFQDDSDIALPGKIKMYKGVNCNGLSSEISFDHFLSENENIRRSLTEGSLQYFIFDPTKNKKHLPTIKITEMVVEVAQEFEELNEDENSSIMEDQENHEEMVIEEIIEEEETEIKVEINLIDSEVTITSQTSKGKGRQSVSYSHEFASRADLFKLIIFRQSESNDSSTKIYLPDLTNDHAFYFNNSSQIEIYLGDYLDENIDFIEFRVNAIGPKAKQENLSFEFYELVQ